MGKIRRECFLRAVSSPPRWAGGGEGRGATRQWWWAFGWYGCSIGWWEPPGGSSGVRAARWPPWGVSGSAGIRQGKASCPWRLLEALSSSLGAVLPGDARCSAAATEKWREVRESVCPLQRARHNVWHLVTADKIRQQRFTHPLAIELCVCVCVYVFGRMLVCNQDWKAVCEHLGTVCQTELTCLCSFCSWTSWSYFHPQTSHAHCFLLSHIYWIKFNPFPPFTPCFKMRIAIT